MMMTPLRVLLVEDQLGDARLIEHELRKAGFEPVAERVETQEAFCAQLNAAPEIILCDYYLPQFSGLAALKVLQERGVDIPVIVVSGGINEEQAIATLRQGAADYLFKDRLGRLGEAVKHALAAKQLRDEKRAAEAALQASEQRHRELVEQSPDALLVVCGEEVVLVNRAALRLFRAVTAGEIVGRPVLELIHPACRQHLLWDLTRVAAEDAPLPVLEERMVRLDGSMVDVELTAAPLLHHGREAMQLFIRDVTERKRADEARHESALQLHIALNAARLATWSWNLAGDKVSWSEGIEALFGFPPGSFQQTIAAYLGCVHPADRDWVEQNLSAARAVESSFEVEHRVRWPDGETRWMYLKGNSAAGDSGAVERISGVVMDITDRKRTEAEMQKLAAFARHNPNPVLEFSVEGRLTYFNAAAQEMALTLGQRHPAEMLPANTVRLVQECLATERSHTRTEATHGERTIAWSFFPILPHQIVHCYARDITERLSLEGQLRQAQKMEAVGQLAGGVAHDFNNLLTIVQGHVSLLLSRRDLHGEAHESLLQVLSAADRAANLTRQLLTFSRKQVILLQRLDLNEVISQVAKLLRRVIGEDVHLRFDYSPGPAFVEADAGMLEQALMNFAINARDAMPHGGTLAVATEIITTTEVQRAFHPEARPGQFVRLTLADTGSGIAAEHLPHIFEPFFTTKEVGKGTGLGLATAYGIVNQHHGWIEVDSQVGRGTTFRIFLPCEVGSAPAEPARPTLEPQPRTEVRGGRETILVVEDEPTLRALVCLVLRKHGYQVLEAESGPAALPVWAQHHRTIDLLLTDMVMPEGMTGRELAEKLKREKPALKVLYTSGYSPDLLGREFPLVHGLNFLQKPFPPALLALTVRQCLDAVLGPADS